MISNITEIHNWNHFLKNLYSYNVSWEKNTISAFIKTNITINHPQDFDLGVCMQCFDMKIFEQKFIIEHRGEFHSNHHVCIATKYITMIKTHYPTQQNSRRLYPVQCCLVYCNRTAHYVQACSQLLHWVELLRGGKARGRRAYLLWRGSVCVMGELVAESKGKQ